MAVINRKQRFATEGIRFQRHNPDGTIPTPERFLGFANTANIQTLGNTAPLTIKVDSESPQTRTVNFVGANSLNRLTVNEAVAALNNANFDGVQFTVDSRTGRLKGSYAGGRRARIQIEFLNGTAAEVQIAPGNYKLFVAANALQASLPEILAIPADETAIIEFESVDVGELLYLPDEGTDLDMDSIVPAFPLGITGSFLQITNGVTPVTQPKKIQVTGRLAAALDFGQGIRHGGNGLEIISFFDDETISIGLPKDIKEKEEIDIEGAKGTVTRMIIGAMLQGLSPVVTLKEKDYFFLELIQGGRLDRLNGTYDPPLSGDSDYPTFFAEIFSAIYTRGVRKITDIAAFEKILLRSMIGMEGDVPIEAKSWATYAYNLVATEYGDENDRQWASWQEQTLSPEEFEGLRVHEISMPAENVSASESR